MVNMLSFNINFKKVGKYFVILNESSMMIWNQFTTNIQIIDNGSKSRKTIYENIWQKATDNDLKGIKEIIGQILDGGKRKNENRARPNPLSFAAFKGNYEVCQYLINSGCDVDARNYVFFNGYNSGKGVAEFTALCESAYAGQLEISELLIEHGADVNVKVGWLAKKSNDNTPLHIAFQKH